MSKSVESEALPQRVKRFYERISVERDAALEDLPRLYSDDVRFINPVVDERGLTTFTEYWKKALRQYKTFEFKNVEVTGTDELFSLTYSMKVRFAFGPTFESDMSTDCHAKNGKIHLCRDFFDPLGMLVQPFGPVSWLYKKLFGYLVA